VNGPFDAKLASPLARRLALRIAAEHENPAEWLLAVRRLAQAADLDVTRCIRTGSLSLDSVCYGVVDYARSQCIPLTKVEAMVDGTKEQS
jgi:hypothetical protein